MKKFILSALLGLALTSTVNNASAQTFTVSTDTIRYTVYAAALVNDNISNITSSPIKVSWHVISNNIPTSWQPGFGICDNYQCYGQDVLTGTTKISDTFSKTCDFHVQLDLSTAPAGTYYLTAEIKDYGGSYTHDVTFILNKFPTSVGSLQQDNNFSLYPSPAHDEVNILFDANAGVKNIAVCNIIGKAVSNFKVSGNSAKLDISNIPAGVYFARLTDVQGRVIATRKFIRQ